ncbi:hypothetical protein EON65_14280 [archaeon]|nr:MAG: hypothetical protein EON65_14280 [archaeon]
MTIFSVLLFTAWISSTLCHFLPKGSFSSSGIWFRGGAGDESRKDVKNTIVLRLRSYDGTVSRLTFNSYKSIQDVALEIAKGISPDLLDHVKVSVKGDAAQDMGRYWQLTIAVIHKFFNFPTISFLSYV